MNQAFDKLKESFEKEYFDLINIDEHKFVYTIRLKATYEDDYDASGTVYAEVNIYKTTTIVTDDILLVTDHEWSHVNTVYAKPYDVDCVVVLEILQDYLYRINNILETYGERYFVTE